MNQRFLETANILHLITYLLYLLQIQFCRDYQYWVTCGKAFAVEEV